jgi:hypothetical protein
MFIVIIQVTYFEYVMDACRKILFLLNPAMWVELHTDNIDEWDEGAFQLRADATKFRNTIHMIYTRKILIFPPVLIAMLMRLLVTWLVIVDSISIILLSSNVLSTIWDCLAIGFLLEFNTYWWQIVHTILHIEPLDTTTFTVSFNHGVWKTPDAKRSELSTLGRKIAICPSFVNLFSRNLPCRDGRGGRRFEYLIVSVMCYFLGMRQVLIVTRALDTGISPMAREICWEYRAHVNGGTALYGIWNWFKSKVLLVNSAKYAHRLVKNKGWEDRCDDEYGDYGKWTLTKDMWHILSNDETGNARMTIAILSVVLFIFFLLPIVMDAHPKKFFTVFKKQENSSNFENTRDHSENMDEEDQKNR